MSLKLAHHDEIDFRELLARPTMHRPLMLAGLEADPVGIMRVGNVLFNDAGFIGIRPSDEFVSEIHVGFDADAHPSAMVRLLREATDAIFARTETIAIFGRTNNPFLHRIGVDRIGFSRIGKDDNGVMVLKLGLVDWMLHSHSNGSVGEELLAVLGDNRPRSMASRLMGSLVQAHRYGQLQKVLKAYHSVAPVFGVPPVKVASWNPVILEVLGKQLQLGEV